MVRSLLSFCLRFLKSRTQLQLEIVYLRKQLEILTRTSAKPRLRPSDRFFISILTGIFNSWKGSLLILKPETVVRWHQQGFKLYWRWKSRSALGRPRIPHGARECLDACSLFSHLLVKALSGCPKEELLFQGEGVVKAAEKVCAIARGDYRYKSEADIHASGYVIHTLEAALWSFNLTDSFESAVLKAVNLGEDADTTGAVSGQIAGAYYGKSQMPERWLGKVAMKGEIQSLARRLFYKDSLGNAVRI